LSGYRWFYAVIILQRIDGKIYWCDFIQKWFHNYRRKWKGRVSGGVKFPYKKAAENEI
jgi:hypothetical protein